jgi:hypothetical protein
MSLSWAGSSIKITNAVIPAQAGIQANNQTLQVWLPACAGMMVLLIKSAQEYSYTFSAHTVAGCCLSVKR